MENIIIIAIITVAAVVSMEREVSDEELRAVVEKAGYKDYLFHAKGSLKGMILGIPVALVAGILVFLIV